MTASVAYLKLINVPTMFDIGCPQSDPSSDYLVLNILDDKSLAIEKEEFLSRVRKFKLAKVEKFRSALKAIHTNMLVSETTIWPQGIITNDTAKQAGFLSGIFGGKQGDSQNMEEFKTASGETVELP